MKKNLVFAGVMGVILMSAGANAATTSVATKGYVDQEVSKVNTTINNLGDTYVTIDEVNTAVGNAIRDADLSQYQTTANMLDSITGTLDETARNTKYPTVGAVLNAISSMVNLTPEQIADLKSLLGEEGVAAEITALKSDVSGLKTNVGTLTGGTNPTESIATQIANAITEHTTTADGKYQAKSTKVSIGNTDGSWLEINATAANAKAALESGINAEKVEAYDALAGDEGSVAELASTVSTLGGTVAGHTTNITNLTTVVGADADHGLQKTVADNASDIDGLVEVVGANATDGLRGAVATNTSNITANAAAIATKIEMPSDCASGNKVCVLMTNNGAISWTPVTDPINDPASGGAQGSVTGEPGSGV